MNGDVVNTDNTNIFSIKMYQVLGSIAEFRNSDSRLRSPFELCPCAISSVPPVPLLKMKTIEFTSWLFQGRMR